MTDAADLSRRQFLTIATTATAGVGAVLAAWPFVASFEPSARARALGAPVEVDFAKLESGAMLKVTWRGRPVWVLRRTEAMLASLPTMDDQLRDPNSLESSQPNYAQNPHRSLRPELLVVVGACTHLGCSPVERFDIGPEDLGSDWPGGFYCPCHGSKFDLAGRVYAGVPAPLNLQIPPYRYTSDTSILIGTDTGGAA